MLLLKMTAILYQQKEKPNKLENKKPLCSIKQSLAVFCLLGELGNGRNKSFSLLGNNMVFGLCHIISSDKLEKTVLKQNGGYL